jgi:hypothetical protein
VSPESEAEFTAARWHKKAAAEVLRRLAQLVEQMAP